MDFFVKEENEIVKAFNAWAKVESIRNHIDIKCPEPHYTLDLKYQPDGRVCLRERRWREYVRIRDNNDNAYRNVEDWTKKSDS
jgi:hypothetical protein